MSYSYFFNDTATTEIYTLSLHDALAIYFDAFWEDVTKQLEKIDIDISCVLDEFRSTEDISVYEVFFNSLDNIRVSGWYAVPTEYTGRLPGLMLVPGYQSDPPIPKEWAKKGYACLSVNPRGKVRSRSQFDPGYPGLLTYGIVDRNTYSYRGFYCDAWRGIDFLLDRDEVDSQRIAVTGSSQGGGLTITTAAMRKEVKAAAAGAPYLCGYMDAIELTHTYPYEEINDYLRHNPGSRSEEHTSELQSLVNLVRRLLLEKKKVIYSTFPLSPPALPPHLHLVHPPFLGLEPAPDLRRPVDVPSTLQYPSSFLPPPHLHKYSTLLSHQHSDVG